MRAKKPYKTPISNAARSIKRAAFDSLKKSKEGLQERQLQDHKIDSIEGETAQKYKDGIADKAGIAAQGGLSLGKHSIKRFIQRSSLKKVQKANQAKNTKSDDINITAENMTQDGGYTSQNTSSGHTPARQHITKPQPHKQVHISPKAAKPNKPSPLYTNPIRPASQQGRFIGLSRQANFLKHQQRKQAQREIRKRSQKKLAKQAAKASKQVFKVAYKSVKFIVNSVFNALKSIILIIASGGGIVLLIIMAVGAILMLLFSPYGIFYSNEHVNDAGVKPLSAIMHELDTELENKVNGIAVDYGEVLKPDSDGDSYCLNWIDVIGVFAVKTSMDKASGMDVVIMDNVKAAKLRDVFWDMNKVTVSQKTIIDETQITDENGIESTVQTQKQIAVISVDGMTYAGAAQMYGFTDQQKAVLEEMMSPKFYAMFVRMLDIDINGGLTPDELAQINADLPEGELGGAIVKAAVSKVGTKYSTLDCSQLTQYAYKSVGINLPRTSEAQAEYCVEKNVVVSKDQLQPGDMIFWRKSGCHCGRKLEVHHTGIYIGNGRIVDSTPSHGGVAIQKLWGGGKWEIIFYARPYVKAN